MKWVTVFWLIVGGLALGGVLHVYQDATAPTYCGEVTGLSVYKVKDGAVHVINEGDVAAGNVSVSNGVDTAYVRVAGGTVQTVELDGGVSGGVALSLVGCPP